MFENIGEKIKALAKALCYIGICASILCGLIVMLPVGHDIIVLPIERFYYSYNATLFIVGLLIAVVGSLASWLSSFMLYGFGELIDSTEESRNILHHISFTLEEMNKKSCDSNGTDREQTDDSTINGNPTPTFQQTAPTSDQIPR